MISSENATDAALQRACYVVVFLLADREDIRRSVYKRRGRAGVIAVTGLKSGGTGGQGAWVELFGFLFPHEYSCVGLFVDL